MADARPSITGSRQELLRRMSAGASEQIVNKTISFANDDVPEYLDNLRRFEEESRKVQIVVS